MVNGHSVRGQIFASNEIDNTASYPNRVIVVNAYQLMDDNANEHKAVSKDSAFSFM